MKKQLKQQKAQIAAGLQEMSKVEDVIQGARDDQSLQMQELYD